MTNKLTLEYMLLFTQTYEEYSKKSICEREARCQQVQLRYCMLPPRPQDLFAGRKATPPIGFLPQAPDSSVGYYCNTEQVLELKNDPAFGIEQRHQLDELLTFWSGKTTKEKIIASYTKEQLAGLTLGDMSTESGAAFPLYRMGGAQMNPAKLLKLGLNGLIEEADSRRAVNPNFYDNISFVLRCLQELLHQYAGEVRASSNSSSEMEVMADNLEWLATNPPVSFWQAMQLSYLFYLVSGTFNYGRMDEYLGSYYAKDVDAGVITEEFALKLTKNLWSLMIERDTQWDARIILGGADRENAPDADRFALIALEASRQLKDVIPQLTLRCHQGMNPHVYQKALNVIGEGTTFPILYNDDVNIPAAAAAFDVELETAAGYVPFGCGEYVLYNQSFGTPSGAINILQALNESVYGQDSLLAKCEDFETFYTAFLNRLKEYILLLAQQEKLEYEICAADSPYLIFSTLFDDCLKRGKPIFDGGIRYLGGTLECYGNTNTADSLTALKTLVYEQKVISRKELIKALGNNFVGYEDLRLRLLQAPKYGNDDEAADTVAVRFHEDVTAAIRNCAKQVGLHSYLAVIINNSMNTTFGLTTGASADGRLPFTYMANANNPTGGMDKNGITALLSSLVKLSPEKHAGSVQNMKFSKDMFGSLRAKTESLLAAYFAGGGTQTMITVQNREDLENALANPEHYQNLIVRVGGFSARFVDLSRAIQQELISRTLY